MANPPVWDEATDAYLQQQPEDEAEEELYLQKLLAEVGEVAEPAAGESSGPPLIPSVALPALPQHPSSSWSVAPFAPCLTVLEAGMRQADPAAAGTVPSKLANFFLGEQPSMHMSKVSVGEMLDVDPQQVEPSLGLLANALLHVESLQRTTLEEALIRSGCRLVMFVDLVRYDETAMKV